MTLKIKRIREKHGTRICLSGELRCSHLIDVRAEIEQVGQPATLDLDSVDVIDIDGVRLLNDCQALGIQVMNYSPYIREWMLQEKANPSRREIAIPFLSPGWMPELYQSLLKNSSVPSQPCWTCWGPDVFPVLSELK
jgi:hypothetical protein